MATEVHGVEYVVALFQLFGGKTPSGFRTFLGVGVWSNGGVARRTNQPGDMASVEPAELATSGRVVVRAL